VRVNFKIFFFILHLATSGAVETQAQTRTIDSLRRVLKTSAQDTNYVKTLTHLAWVIGRTYPDSAIIITGQALSLSQKIKWKKGEAASELRLGVFCLFQSKYKEAVVHYNNVLKVCEMMVASSNSADAKIGKKYWVKALGSIANSYLEQSDYPKALEYYLRALKISEEMGDKEQVGMLFGGIAIVYRAQSDYVKALEYNLKSLKLANEVGDKQHVCNTLVNIGNIYKSQARNSMALEYYSQALKVAEEIGDKRSIGFALSNIGGVYFNQGDSAVKKSNLVFGMTDRYPKALKYYIKSLKISEELGDKQQVGITAGNMGNLYTNMGKYNEAEEYLKRAVLIGRENGALDFEKDHHYNLFCLYEKTTRHALALKHYKKFISLRDTIFSQENNKKIMRSEMDHEYEKKKAVTDAEHNMEIQNQKLITDEKNKKQNIVIGSVIAGLILVLIFAAFVFSSLRTTRKQKHIIELKNIETEHQKKEIEEHQKEILDSIRYAKRIQMAQIPSEKRVGNILLRLRKL